MTVEATAKFFDLIHGPGWRCLFTLPDRRHYWFETSEQMAQAALGLDARNLAVFHSCATFDAKERKQDHVRSLKCFWLDIDAGPSKPYANADEAYRALEKWRAAAGLPPALVVVSGGGLHAYFALRDSLDLWRWHGGAHNLRALAQQYGLQIDPGSTIDAARILRPPGTHNRKLLDASGKKLADVGGEPRPVLAGPLVGPYSEQDLAVLFSSESSRIESLGGTIPDYLKGVKDADGLANVGDADRPSDPHLVAQRCVQVARLRDTRGQLPEPEWYAILGVLAHCGEPGHTAAHAWSAGDERYRPGDTAAKLAQYLSAADGPTTCARLNALVPGSCILCPYNGKITSPIQLGRDLPASVSAPAPPKLSLPLLPKSFLWAGSKLACEREPTDEDPSPYYVISEYPVVVDELQELERTKRISAVFRSWEPMLQDWRDFSLYLGELVGTAGHGKVADQGVIVPQKRWADFVRYANACAVEYRGTRHYGVRYEQFGWKDATAGPGFVLGDELLLKGAAPQRIHGADEVERRGRLMEPQGDARKWSEAASALINHKGMEAHGFMLLCAFAAPLYRFTGEPGAPFVHGTTRASGKGKTTMLEAGASVYGHPDATSIVERDTMVAKFITLGTLCNLPIFFDELRFPSPDDTKHYVLQGTLGRDKQRAKAEGGLRSDHLSWSTIHISAANISLTDTVRADSAEVAQAARIFEFTLSLPEGMKTTDGDALKRILRENRGTAGRAFLQHVLDQHEWVEKSVPARMKFYEESMQAGPEERFVIRLFACVDVAGALVRRFGLFDCDLDAIMAWAVGVQKGNANRLAVEGAVDASAVLSQMVNDLVPNTIVMPRPAALGKQQTMTPLRQAHSELKARLEVEGRQLLIDISAVRSWMQAHGYSFTEMQKELVGLGVLKDPRTRKTLAAGSGLSVGQTWCWLVDGQHPLLADLIETVAAPEGNVVSLRGVK